MSTLEFFMLFVVSPTINFLTFILASFFISVVKRYRSKKWFYQLIILPDDTVLIKKKLYSNGTWKWERVKYSNEPKLFSSMKEALIYIHTTNAITNDEFIVENIYHE